ncbi:MAG TPA: PAS domain-containing protein, partial [Candidatus Limnocylindrales bacterium]
MTAHEPPRAARSEAPGERPRPGPDPARHSARDAAGTALATAALDAMPDSVIVTDLGMTVRAWNPGAERLYGIDAQEAIGRSVTDLLDSRIVGRPPDLEGVLAATLTNGTWRGRIVDRPRIGSRAGHEIGVEVRTAVIRDANRRPVATLALGRDVAEQGRPDLGDEERLHEELL